MPGNVASRREPFHPRHALRLGARPREHELRSALFPVSDEEAIDEGRERLGVRRDRTATHDERVVLGARLGAERHAAEVEHREHVRVRELELQREPEHVELAQGAPALERPERLALRAERRLHVVCGGIRALGQEGGVRVERGVEDLVPEVAHPDLVEVGEREAHPPRHPVPVLPQLPRLASEVLRRPPHPLDETPVRMLADSLSFRALGDCCAGGPPHCQPGGLRPPSFARRFATGSLASESSRAATTLRAPPSGARAGLRPGAARPARFARARGASPPVVRPSLRDGLSRLRVVACRDDSSCAPVGCSRGPPARRCAPGSLRSGAGRFAPRDQK